MIAGASVNRLVLASLRSVSWKLTTVCLPFTVRSPFDRARG